MNASKANDGGVANAIAVEELGSDEYEQGLNEWLNKVECLCKLNHPNIVKLLGYCCEDDHRMVVYEYMNKGSLEAHLLREHDTELDWIRRIRIAVEAARGVEYLHTRSKPLIHGDLKASNILLDTDFTAKISNFGLTKSGGDVTVVPGTGSCFAPDYFATGELTTKTDVFSFGVVLLEMLSGCGGFKNNSDGMFWNLTEWAIPHLSNKLELHNLIDKKLKNIIPLEEAQNFAKIILRCLTSNPITRPTMSQVIADLEKLQQSMDNPNTAILQMQNLHT